MHNGQHIIRRDLRRYTMSEGKSDMGAEMGLLGLCILSGLVGMYWEDVRLTVTIFVGGLGTWLALSIPTMIANAKAKIQKQTEEREAALAAAAAPPKRAYPSHEQVLDLIKGRRTIFPKDFSGAKVSKEHINQLLEAANWAPTHNLTQPWRFVVLEGESKARFEDLTIQLVGKYTQPAEKAAEAVERMKGKASKAWPLISHYIVVCMSKVTTKAGKTNPEWEDLASVACAVQNMYLLATALGLAPYWSSWQTVARTAPEMLEFLGLDAAAGDQCFGVFVVGMSDRADSYRGSRTPAMDKVTWMS